MTTDQEVDEFLAHFGKKGMKWGQHAAKTPAQKAETRRKVTKAAGVTLAVAGIGLMATSVILKKHGQMKVNAANIENLRRIQTHGFVPRGFNLGGVVTRPGAIPMPSGDKVRAAQAAARIVRPGAIPMPSVAQVRAATASARAMAGL